MDSQGVQEIQNFNTTEAIEFFNRETFINTSYEKWFNDGLQNEGITNKENVYNASNYLKNGRTRKVHTEPQYSMEKYDLPEYLPMNEPIKVSTIRSKCAYDLKLTPEYINLTVPSQQQYPPIHTTTFKQTILSPIQSTNNIMLLKEQQNYSPTGMENCNTPGSSTTENNESLLDKNSIGNNNCIPRVIPSTSLHFQLADQLIAERQNDTMLGSNIRDYYCSISFELEPPVQTADNVSCEASSVTQTLDDIINASTANSEEINRVIQDLQHDLAKINDTTIGGRKKRGPYKKRVKDPKLLLCHICAVNCVNNSALNLHMNTIHLKERRHKCRSCPKNFSRIRHLRDHEAGHLVKERNFECQTCHNRFKTPQSLRSHQVTHLPARFKCEICSKKYKSNYQLKEHLNIHRGKLDYPCNYCQKRFVSIDRLKIHLRTHVKTKFQCEYCPTKTKAIQGYKVHLIRSHSDVTKSELAERVLRVNNLRFDFITMEYVPRS